VPFSVYREGRWYYYGTRLPFRQLVREAQEVTALIEHGYTIEQAGKQLGHGFTWAWRRHVWLREISTGCPGVTPPPPRPAAASKGHWPRPRSATASARPSARPSKKQDWVIWRLTGHGPARRSSRASVAGSGTSRHRPTAGPAGSGGGWLISVLCLLRAAVRPCPEHSECADPEGEG
jgi:hypothetical protein